MAPRFRVTKCTSKSGGRKVLTSKEMHISLHARAKSKVMTFAENAEPCVGCKSDPKLLEFFLPDSLALFNSFSPPPSPAPHSPHSLRCVFQNSSLTISVHCCCVFAAAQLFQTSIQQEEISQICFLSLRHRGDDRLFLARLPKAAPQWHRSLRTNAQEHTLKLHVRKPQDCK